MSGTKGPAPEGLVTSDAVYHGHLFRQLLLGLAGLVVLGGAGVGTYLAAQKFGLISSSESKQPAQQAAVTPQQAIKNAQAELQQAGTAKEKAAAYSHLGEAYLDNNQINEAVASDNAALSDAQGASDTTAEALALGDLVVAYSRAGDTANEIKTIELLIPVLQRSSDPDDKRLAFRYQSLLDSLKGQQ